MKTSQKPVAFAVLMMWRGKNVAPKWQIKIHWILISLKMVSFPIHSEMINFPSPVLEHGHSFPCPLSSPFPCLVTTLALCICATGPGQGRSFWHSEETVSSSIFKLLSLLFTVFILHLFTTPGLILFSHVKFMSFICYWYMFHTSV